MRGYIRLLFSNELLLACFLIDNLCISDLNHILESQTCRQNGQAGAFAQNQGFNQGAMYGGSPFYSQTAGSNPFG